MLEPGSIFVHGDGLGTAFHRTLRLLSLPDVFMCPKQQGPIFGLRREYWTTLACWGSTWVLHLSDTVLSTSTFLTFASLILCSIRSLDSARHCTSAFGFQRILHCGSFGILWCSFSFLLLAYTNIANIFWHFPKRSPIWSSCHPGLSFKPKNI